MTALIIGGAASGKSQYAEALTQSLATDRLFYLATMAQGDSPEAAQRVEKHRFLRTGKGFETMEQPYALALLLPHLQPTDTLLLECLSNLLANEMYLQGKSTALAARDVVADVNALARHCAHLVCVGNNIFADGTIYDSFTNDYLAAMGTVQAELAQAFDHVTEVVVGIPLHHKGGVQA